MEMTKVVKPFIKREWANTFVNIVYTYNISKNMSKSIEACTGELKSRVCIKQPQSILLKPKMTNRTRHDFVDLMQSEAIR